jgi:hypothetical protein
VKMPRVELLIVITIRRGRGLDEVNNADER